MHVPKSVLQRYVGEYEYIAGQMNRTDLRVWIFLREDVLTQKLHNDNEKVLIPLSETRFNVSGRALVLEFVLDDAWRDAGYGLRRSRDAGAPQALIAAERARA